MAVGVVVVRVLWRWVLWWREMCIRDRCCGGEGAVVGAVAVGADLFLAEIS
ncbi:hypothetical protein MNL09_07220 [Bartonella krasnovii]|nr:hypothetical protein MNL09_07220 [Bartonella krasnovii]